MISFETFMVGLFCMGFGICMGGIAVCIMVITERCD